MPDKWKIGIEFLEEGDIFFYYKLLNKELGIKDLENIISFYIKLQPKDSNHFRILQMRQNKLPILSSKENISRGYIDESDGKKPFDDLSAGVGTYAILYHENKHTHLIYSLEVPKRTGKIQNILNIKRKGNFIISIRNPNITHKDEETSQKYLPTKPVKLLDNKGNEIMFIASGKDYERLGIIHI